MPRRLKNAFIRLCVRALAGALGLVPGRAVLPVGRALGALAYGLAARERRIAVRNLRDAYGPSMTEVRARILTRGVFAHLGASAVEICRALRTPSGDLPARFSPGSREILERALAEGQGAVLACGHLGNWELLAAHLARSGFPLTAVVKESYDPGITRSVERARSRLGIETTARSGPGSAAAMLRALRRGRILGLLIDQDTRVPGRFVRFFGQWAFTPTGAAKLAARTGAPLLVGTIRRGRRGSHTVEIQEVQPPFDEESGTARATALLERAVRRTPSGWVWIHERWKTRPGPPVDPAIAP